MESALVQQLVVAGTAMVVTAVVTPFVALLARRVGAVKVPGERHIHSRPVPELGGLAMLAGVVSAFAVATRLDSFDQLFRTTSEPEAILLAGMVIAFVGFIDDTRMLPAASKLAGQVVAAGVLVLFGVTLRFVYIPFAGGSIVSLSPDAAALVTILAVVAMINAVNLVDGLDGLAAGIVAIGAAALFAYAEFGPSSPVPVDFEISAASLVLAAIVGVCLGFLVHNFNPASIFMGDTGAMLLGLLLASAGVSAIGNTLQPTSSDFFVASVPVLIPALVLAVPFVDTVLAISRRLGTGQSIATADKKHLHHRLVEIGHSQRRAVLILYGWSAIVAAAVVGPTMVDVVVLGPVLAVAAGGLVLSQVLDTRRRRRQRQAIARADNVVRHPGADGPRHVG